MTSLPTLYTFRRCPYAMRARMALHYAGVTCELIEVDLKHKPAEMLAISPKGTVPVLQLRDGTVLEQSLDIMRYALSQNDPEGWLNADAKEMERLITQNDTVFKSLLDKFKYHIRYPEHSQAEHQANGAPILQQLEDLLNRKRFLLADHVTLADVALFPFIRQWAGVTPGTLNAFPKLQHWLDYHLASDVFTSVM